MASIAFRLIFAVSALIAVLFFNFLPPSEAESFAADGTAKVKGTMQHLAAAVEQLAPFAYEQKVISDPVYYKTVTDELDTVVRAAASLKSHSDLGQDFTISALMIRADAEQALADYKSKAFKATTQRLVAILDSCANCHTSIKAAQAPAVNITRLVDQAQLTPLQRATMLTTARQFPEAMAAYERVLASENFTWYEFSRASPLLDYLIVGIRVQNDLPRVRKTLVNIQSKKDLPAYFAVYLDRWVQSIDHLAANPQLAKPSLANVKSLMAEALKQMDYQTDRTGLVYYLTAGGMLRQLLIKSELTPDQKSEAYYLLGVIELIAGRSQWLPEAAGYLEAAVRASPGSPTARKAYALLEEHVIIFAYTVNAERLVPAELSERIKSLRPLALGAGAKP